MRYKLLLAFVFRASTPWCPDSASTLTLSFASSQMQMKSLMPASRRKKPSPPMCQISPRRRATTTGRPTSAARAAPSRR